MRDFINTANMIIEYVQGDAQSMDCIFRWFAADRGLGSMKQEVNVQLRVNAIPHTLLTLYLFFNADHRKTCMPNLGVLRVHQNI